MKGYRAYKISSATTTQLISTANAKTFLKVDTSADDTIINNLVVAATRSAEEYTNRLFITQELEQYAPVWTGVGQLFKSPVSAVSSITYFDESNASQTLSASVYSLNNVLEPARIELKVDQEFPNLADRWDAIKVTYSAGYGTATTDVPMPIIQAVYLTIGHWYENRQSVIVGRQVNEMPMTSKYLLDQYKVQVIV